MMQVFCFFSSGGFLRVVCKSNWVQTGTRWLHPGCIKAKSGRKHSYSSGNKEREAEPNNHGKNHGKRSLLALGTQGSEKHSLLNDRVHLERFVFHFRFHLMQELCNPFIYIWSSGYIWYKFGLWLHKTCKVTRAAEISSINSQRAALKSSFWDLWLWLNRKAVQPKTQIYFLHSQLSARVLFLFFAF